MTKKTRPRLSAGTTIQIATNPARPDLAGDDRAIRTGDDREALPLRAGRSLLGLLLGAGLITVAIAAILSATVMVALDAGENRAVVLRGAYPIDAIPSGAVVYGSSAPAATNFTGRVTQALVGVPAGAVVQVIAGPNDNVSTNTAGIVTANGKPTAFKVQITPARLDRQYIALCLAGAGCAPGTAVTLSQDNIVGEVRGYLGITGLTAVPTTVPTHTR